MNPKYLQEDSEAEPKGHKRLDAPRPNHGHHTGKDDTMLNRSTGSPHHQHGVKLQNEKIESEQKRQEALQTRHVRQLNQDEGYLRNTDSSLRNANAARKAPFESPQHLYGGLSAGDTTKKASRQSMESDHSNEHSPLHPHFNVRTGVKGIGVSSPSWERKGSSEGGHGVAPFTPGRSRLRSITKGDDTVMPFLIPSPHTFYQKLESKSTIKIYSYFKTICNSNGKTIRHAKRFSIMVS